MIFHVELFQYSSEQDNSKFKYSRRNESLVIIYHEVGHANSGHYTCSIRSNEKWHTISDSSVTTEK